MGARKAKSRKTSRKPLAYRIAAAATVAALCGFESAAFAQMVLPAAVKTNTNMMTRNAIVSSNGLAQLMSLLAYVGGVSLVIAGVLKLKQHADEPSHVPMRQGLIRLLAAGMLLSLPFMTKVMQGDVSAGKANSGVAVISNVVRFGSSGGAFTMS